MGKTWVVRASALEVAEALRAAEIKKDWALVDFWSEVLIERLDMLGAIVADSGTATGTDS